MFFNSWCPCLINIPGPLVPRLLLLPTESPPTIASAGNDSQGDSSGVIRIPAKDKGKQRAKSPSMYTSNERQVVSRPDIPLVKSEEQMSFMDIDAERSIPETRSQRKR